MKVSGFTFIRNAVKFDFPIVEAIQSILPLCDEVIVAVGKSEDDTRTLVESINSDKIKIIDTVWDDSLREGGVVLARETDKAFAAIAEDTDWAVYIQGDEVLHEDGIEHLKETMLHYKDREDVDGLLFNYLHFYGSYDYVGDSNSWYPHEIRIVRNRKDIYSYRDAQGFRMGNNEKLRVVSTKAKMHHYGWVKPPNVMQEKRKSVIKFWKDDEWIKEHVADAEDFDYNSIDSLKKFEGSHPKVMQLRVQRTNWHFERDMSRNKTKMKDAFKNFLKKFFGIQLGYRNYTLVK